jgi:hypothetical protein
VELAELAWRLERTPLPAELDLPGLVAALARARNAREIVRRELPLAVDTYVRCCAWELLAPSGVDPAAALVAEVDRLLARASG